MVNEAIRFHTSIGKNRPTCASLIRGTGGRPFLCPISAKTTQFDSNDKKTSDNPNCGIFYK